MYAGVLTSDVAESRAADVRRQPRTEIDDLNNVAARPAKFARRVAAIDKANRRVIVKLTFERSGG
jgi:hypothetical protein